MLDSRQRRKGGCGGVDFDSVLVFDLTSALGFRR